MIGYRTVAEMHEAASTAQRYLYAKPFIDLLKKNARYLTGQQYRTLKGQAVTGDVAGAYRGLETLLRRRAENG